MSGKIVCAGCKKPVRKGSGIVTTIFARYAGLNDLQQPVAEPYLTVVAHLREGCMTSLTPEVIREARKAGVVAMSGRPA